MICLQAADFLGGGKKSAACFVVFGLLTLVGTRTRPNREPPKAASGVDAASDIF